MGSAGVGTLVLAFWVGPRIWRIAKERGFYTVGDFLEYRYGAAVRGSMAALLWVGTLAILAGQLIALARVLQVVVGLPHYAGCLIGGLVMTTYFTAGGLLGSAWVNLVQLAVLLTGFAVAVPIALGRVGGWSGIASAAPVAAPDFLGFFNAPESGWVYYLALLAPAFVISPGLLQKVFGARSAQAVRVGVGVSGVALLIFAAAPALLGMIARVQYPGLEVPELALPTVLMQDLPVFPGSVALGALFVADISSADAILFMLATSLSQDLYRRFINPKASDERLLRVARWAAVGGGVSGVMLAIVLSSVVGALTIFYTLLVVSLFVPIVAGLYTKRAGTPEAFASIGAGIAVIVAVRLATDNAGFGFLTPNLLGLGAAAVGFIAVMIARTAKSSQLAAGG